MNQVTLETTQPLEVVVRLTGSHRRKILFYCQKGVVQPAEEKGKLMFDEEAVLRLQHIESLRNQHRMNWAAIQTIIGLLGEIEDLREELRWRR